MAFQPVAKSVRVELRQRLDGEAVENVWHVRHDDAAWTVDQIALLAASVAEWWALVMAPLLSTSIELVEVYVQDLTGEFGTQYSWTTDLPVAGEVNGECSTNQTAACVSFTTGIAGRGHRGRTYLAGIPEGYVAQNLLQSGFRTNVITALNGFPGMLAALADPAEHVVVSYVLNGAPRAAGVATLITGRVFRSPYVKSQRGRARN